MVVWVILKNKHCPDLGTEVNMILSPSKGLIDLSPVLYVTVYPCQMMSTGDEMI